MLQECHFLAKASAANFVMRDYRDRLSTKVCLFCFIYNYLSKQKGKTSRLLRHLYTFSCIGLRAFLF